MKVTDSRLLTAADLPAGYAEKLKESIKKLDLKNRKNPNEGSVLPTTEPADTGLRKWKLSTKESNLLKGFRLEEYVDLIRKMQVSDPEAYKSHLKNLQDADYSDDPGAKVSEYTKPYIWAYGDILDILYKDNPDLDVFIRSAGTPENFEFRGAYHKKNQRRYLIISTDEIKLLQSKDARNKESQTRLWKTIWNRIKY